MNDPASQSGQFPPGQAQSPGESVAQDRAAGMGQTIGQRTGQNMDDSTGRFAGRNAEQGHGERILYLDDEAPLVFLVTRMLKSLGYHPQGFSDAADALAAFQQDPRQFALVLTDLSMPGTSGFEFASQVLACDRGARVVIVSGAVDPADAERARAVGAQALLQKPSTVEEFARVVSRILTETAATQAP